MGPEALPGEVRFYVLPCELPGPSPITASEVAMLGVDITEYISEVGFDLREEPNEVR